MLRFSPYRGGSVKGEDFRQQANSSPWRGVNPEQSISCGGSGCVSLGAYDKPTASEAAPARARATSAVSLVTVAGERPAEEPGEPLQRGHEVPRRQAVQDQYWERGRPRGHRPARLRRRGPGNHHRARLSGRGPRGCPPRRDAAPGTRTRQAGDRPQGRSLRGKRRGDCRPHRRARG